MQTPRHHLFTKEYQIGDLVAIIRTEHGWLDGALSGKITEINENSCIVTTKDGITYNINHPRDIYRITHE